MSLGKVEAQLKTHSLVENICVYGDPYRYGLNFLCLSINFQDFPTSIDMYFISLLSTRNENNCVSICLQGGPSGQGQPFVDIAIIFLL